MSEVPEGYKRVCIGCYANTKNKTAIAISEKGVSMYSDYDGGKDPSKWKELKTYDNFDKAFDEIRRDNEFMTSDEL